MPVANHQRILLRFFVARVAMMALTLLLVSVAVFLLVRLVPGDPAAVLLGEGADAESIAAIRADLGLDQGLVVQFVTWIGHALRGDLGYSIFLGEPVLPLVLQRYLVSAPIVLVAVILAVTVSVPLGTIAAWKRGTGVDRAVVTGSTILLSIPAFWLGLLLLIFFGLQLGWLPVVGYVSLRNDFGAGILYLILPIATLFLHEIGVLTRMVRASTLEIVGLDYVSHARAKGLSEGAVLRRHVFRNAFLPTWTLIGLVLGNLLGGIAVIETVFTIPGLGRLLVEAIFARDYPLIQGCILVIAASYVVVNTIIDLVYPLLDPKVGLQ